jgi:hypothetical protein
LKNISKIEAEIASILSELEKNPEHAPLLHDLGIGYHLLGQFGNAIVYLKKSL